jgi:hypothetical protein
LCVAWKMAGNDSKGFLRFGEACREGKWTGLLLIRARTKNAGLATVTLISAPNPVSQVLW